MFRPRRFTFFPQGLRRKESPTKAVLSSHFCGKSEGLVPNYTPNGGEGRVNCNLLIPLPWAEGDHRSGEGVAADGGRVFSVDGVVRCIIWVINLQQAG